MVKLRILACGASLLMRSALSLHAQSDSAAYVPNELILKLRNGSEAAALVSDHTELGITNMHSIFPSLNIYHFSFSGVSMAECMQELEADIRVIRARPNYYTRSDALNVIPNDPGYVSQSQMGVIQAPDAWNITTGGETVNGDEIVIAVLDGGFANEHEDLDYWKNENEIPGNTVDDDENNLIDDYSGWNFVTGTNEIETNNVADNNHGTHVAGIIGAIGDNGDDVAGVNWHVKILPIVACCGGTKQSIISAYNYVYWLRRRYNETNGEDGAFIVATNASFSYSEESYAGLPEENQERCDVFDELGSVGVLNINSPTNRSEEIGSPAPGWGDHFNDIPAMCASPWLIVVTNTWNSDELGENAPWSTQYVDIAAPGMNVLSTTSGNQTGYNSGTSMAAPFVAGAVGLLYAAACQSLANVFLSDPSLAAWTVRPKILNEADIIPASISLIHGGRLNIYKSVNSLLEERLETIWLTGIEQASEDYEAIESVEAEDYSSQFDLSVIAGEQIVIGPTTLLLPSDNEGQSLIVDPAYFSCSVPVAPMDISMYAPDLDYCGFPYWVECNVDVDEGLAPFTYSWYSRLVTENDWSLDGSSSYLALFFHDQDFFVKVVVTDAMGTSIEAPAQLVVCINGGMAMNPVEPHAEANRVVLNDISVVPNPVTERIRVFFAGNSAGAAEAVAVLDESGRVVLSYHPRREDTGAQWVEFPHSLATGCYTLIVESATEMRYARFIVAK